MYYVDVIYTSFQRIFMLLITRVNVFSIEVYQMRQLFYTSF